MEDKEKQKYKKLEKLRDLEIEKTVELNDITRQIIELSEELGECF